MRHLAFPLFRWRSAAAVLRSNRSRSHVAEFPKAQPVTQTGSTGSSAVGCASPDALRTHHNGILKKDINEISKQWEAIAWPWAFPQTRQRGAFATKRAGKECSKERFVVAHRGVFRRSKDHISQTQRHTPAATGANTFAQPA